MKTCAQASAFEVVSAELRKDLGLLAESLTVGVKLEALSCRSERILVRAGDVVIKVHAASTAGHELEARLQIVTQAPWNTLFLRALDSKLKQLAECRSATLWPWGRALDSEAEDIPWEEGARLLAALHRIPVSPSSFSFPLPRCRAPLRAKTAIAQLDSIADEQRDEDWAAIRRAAKILDWTEAGALSWVHGDWHLGQLVDTGRQGSPCWRLIDIDDMGVGQAVWDLARPAAFFAAGLLPPEAWDRFVSAYRDAGGPAMPRVGDVWRVLEKPARILTVQSAAVAFGKSRVEGRALREDEMLLINACRRIVAFDPIEL